MPLLSKLPKQKTKIIEIPPKRKHYSFFCKMLYMSFTLTLTEKYIGEGNMKPQKNRILSIIALIALLSASAIVVIPANAHTPPWNIPTYAYITASPNPVGPGQNELLVFWLDIPPPTAAGTTGDRWHPYTVDITKPDGTVVHLGPYTSDPVGSGYAVYVPDVTGTYSAKFSFAGQTAQLANPNNGLNGTASNYVGDNYLASSATTTFVVRQTAVQYFQEAPFPVSYWTRPINENNQGWQTIASSWLGQNEFGATYLKYQPYGRAPSTAHVIWTYPLSWGGMVGGDNAVTDYMSFYSGTQYQLKFANPIIMYGNVYFSLPVNNAPTGNGVTAVNLRTGQTVWTNPALTSVNFGQLYDFDSPNQHGTTGSYLWVTGFAPNIFGTGIVNPGAAAISALSGTYAPGTSLGAVPSITNSTAVVNALGWMAVDPQTGKLLFNETNVPSGARAYGPQGEWLIYGIGRANLTAPFTYLWQWNNTKLPGNDIAGGITQWLPGITNYNMIAAYDWNVTLSQPLGYTYTTIGALGGLSAGAQSYDPTTGIYTCAPTVLRVLPGDLIFGQSSGLQQTSATSNAIFGTPDPFVLWAMNLNATRGPIGQVMWVKNYPAPANNLTVLIGPEDQGTNIFTLYYRETMQWSGYDMLTGNFLWGPTPMENAWNFYGGTTGLTAPYALGYGHLYSSGYSGTLYCYDLKTGKTLFTFGNDPNDPNNSTLTPETVYGDYPTQVAAVVNNKVYMVEEEHSLNAPAYHGAKTRCVDAFSGKLLWDIYGISSWQQQAVADGYYTWLNLNDMQIYAMGPGPSATTVTGPNIGIALGGSAEITGTVTDQSPNIALKGTPAISDQDQGVWMEYMVQHSVDTPHVTGVPVHLTAVDANHNTIDLGTVTSDQNGVFHKLWAPPAAGEYTIVANFMGTDSYGPSSASTAVGVVPAAAPAPTTAPPATATPPPTTATPSPTPQVTATPVPPPSNPGIPATYIIIAVVAIIIVVAAAALLLRRRK